MSAAVSRSARESRRVPRYLLSALLALSLVVPLATASLAGAAVAGTTTRVSLTDGDAQADDRTQDFSMTPDGRYIAFASYAENLVATDDNGQTDVFVRDTVSGTTEIVSVSSTGVKSNDYSAGPQISADGRFVVFYSHATNLVDNDTNGQRDIFLRDLTDDTTVRVSVKSDGTQANDSSTFPTINWNGSMVAFASDATNLVTTGVADTNGRRDVFVHIVASGVTTLESKDSSGILGNGESTRPALSGNGSYVYFDSDATNLVPGDTNSARDVFVRALSAGNTGRISVDSNGVQANGMSQSPHASADGRYVVFNSIAGNLVAGDTNAEWDVFLRDVNDGVEMTTERINVSSAEEQANQDTWSPESMDIAVTADGRYVAFKSGATNLVASDTNGWEDVFVRDRTEGTTSRVSLASSGEQANNDCGQINVDISSDGRYVAFDSIATNLVANDTNLKSDTFMHDRFGDPDYTIEVDGVDRFHTAIEASKKAYPSGLDPLGDKTVVIATGRNWPDALGGVALAGVLDGPVLLVDTNSVPQDVQDEIDRLGAEKAIILGGTSAVGELVETTLNNGLGAANVDRIGEADRYLTADAVAERVISEQGVAYDGRAFVATGGNFPDALAAAPAAAKMGWPLFLSRPGVGLSSATKVSMDQVVRAVVLGGTSAVPESVLTYLKAELGDLNAYRIDGDSRYETAANVAEDSVDEAGLGWEYVGITTGEKFPDALAGGVLQAKMDSVMLLTTPATLHPDTEAQLVVERDDITTVTFFGGLTAVTQPVRDAVMAAIE